MKSVTKILNKEYTDESNFRLVVIGKNETKHKSWIWDYFGVLKDDDLNNAFDLHFCKICYLINERSEGGVIKNDLFNIQKYSKKTSVENHANHLQSKHNFIKNSSEQNQAKIDQIMIGDLSECNSDQPKKRLSQENFNIALTNLVVCTNQSFNFVEDKHFIKFLIDD